MAEINGLRASNIFFDEYAYPVEYFGTFDINYTEEQKVNKCEFELGDIIIGKDEFVNIKDGEVVLIAPGYKEEDFTVTKTPKGVSVIIDSFDDVDFEEDEVQEFFFEYNECFEVDDVLYNVRDGLLVLQVLYSLGENVVRDENL